MHASNSFPENIIGAVKEIKLLALDVDGVLTDGSIYIDADGNESKKFHVHDGYGIISIREKFGIETVVISGRSSKALLHRLEELKISRYWIEESNKLNAKMTQNKLTQDDWNLINAVFSSAAALDVDTRFDDDEDNAALNVNGDLEVYLPEGSEVGELIELVEEDWSTNGELAIIV